MKHKEILGLILLACLFLIPLFKPGLYVSHDGDAHVARFAAYAQTFADGQFPARWAGNLNFGYGTPIFIFYYPLPGYVASVLHLFPLSFENIYELLMAVSFIGGILTFFLWAKVLFNRHVAFIGAILYGFAPYHFLDIYVRGDIAEIMAFAFVPLVFFFIEQFLQKQTKMVSLLR